MDDGEIDDLEGVQRVFTGLSVTREDISTFSTVQKPQAGSVPIASLNCGNYLSSAVTTRTEICDR